MRNMCMSLALVGLLVAGALASGGVSIFQIAVGTGTATVQVATGPGTLYTVAVTSSTSAGNYAVCVDSAGVTGVSVSGQSNWIARTDPYSSSWPAINQPNQPVAFTKGLTCFETVSTATTTISYIQP